MVTPKTKIYCTTKQFKEKSGAGMIIIMVDEQGQEHTRQFGWALKLTPPELAIITAARLALCSIIPRFRRIDTTLYINDLKLENEEWKQSIDCFKQWVKYYPKLEILNLNDPKYLESVEQLAFRAARTQNNYDSGTN